MHDDTPPATTGPTRRTGFTVLVAGVLLVVSWQVLLFRAAPQSSYKITASGGVLPWQREFVHFLYYLNLFPIAVDGVPHPKSAADARQIIADHGQALVMDRYWTVRYGERLKTYLYLPHCYLQGTSKPGSDPRARAHMRYANGPAFMLSLAMLFAAFWWLDEVVLGALLVVLLGSDPFQVSEVYFKNNIFGWNITAALLVLALHAPLFGRNRPPLSYCFFVPLATGLLLATVRQIRTEPILIIASAAGAYLVARSWRWWQRAAALALLAAAFLAGTSAWSAYFDRKFQEAYRVVRDAGGHPYDGVRQVHHFFWHSLWCGLGDFDERHGHRWDDVAAKDWALGIMRRDFGWEPRGYPAPPPPAPLDRLVLGVAWDKDGKYPKTPFEEPLYGRVVRDGVLRDIRNDPMWYAGILARRLGRILTTTTPPSVCIGSRWLSLPDVPLYGFLILPAVALCAWRRDVLRLALLAFTLPLATTAFAVYSGGGTPYYDVFHLVAFAILAESGAIALARRVIDRIRPRKVPSPGYA